ncbi:MAG: hypothetical protein HY537_13350, partial [Deltaproteobacteria bacterium]|nr:hypothetical protein [Deltaproteobacteria bacterium]
MGRLALTVILVGLSLRVFASQEVFASEKTYPVNDMLGCVQDEVQSILAQSKTFSQLKVSHLQLVPGANANSIRSELDDIYKPPVAQRAYFFTAQDQSTSGNFVGAVSITFMTVPKFVIRENGNGQFVGHPEYRTMMLCTVSPSSVADGHPAFTLYENHSGKVGKNLIEIRGTKHKDTYG